MPERAQQKVTSGDPERISVTILNGQSLSDAGYVRGRLVGLEIPSAWTAAAITFQGSVNGTTFVDLWDNAQTATATERTIASGNVPTASTRGFPLSLNDWTGWNYIKVRSGTSGAAVNQGADRSIGLILAG